MLPLVKCLHDAWRKHAKQITHRHVHSVNSPDKPRINFIISNLKQFKAFVPSTSCASSYCNSSLTMASSSAYSARNTAGKGKGEAKAEGKGKGAGAGETQKVFADIKMAFTILPDEKKSWEEHMRGIVSTAMLVCEDNDNLLDVRNIPANQADRYLGAHAGMCLKALGSPIADQLTTRIINSYAPEVPNGKQWPNVSICGDSGICQYHPPKDGGRPVQDNSEVRDAIQYSFKHMIPDTRTRYCHQHRCNWSHWSTRYCS
jgi:hypothetical protein